MQIEGVVNQCEQSTQMAKALEQENLRLQKEVYTLQAREHLKKHAYAQQGGRDNSPISVDEFMKQRRKAEDMERLANDLQRKLDAVTVDKVVIIIIYEYSYFTTVIYVQSRMHVFVHVCMFYCPHRDEDVQYLTWFCTCVHSIIPMSIVKFILYKYTYQYLVCY